MKSDNVISFQGQLQLFNRIREKLPAQYNLVDVISELLHISDDSTYRRVRGDTPISLEEAFLLAKQYQLSLDEILNLNPNQIYFNYNSISTYDLDFGAYYSNMAKIMGGIRQAENPHMIYAAMDIPIFQYFHFMEIILFKTYFWKKTIWEDPRMKTMSFDLEFLSNKYGESIQRDGDIILDAYLNISSIELWNDWTIISTIKQIEFCLESGFFKHRRDCRTVLEQLYKLVEHIQEQTTCGYKYRYNQKPEKKQENYQVFLNEVLFLANSVAVQTNQMRQVFVVHEAINFLSTSDKSFCDETFEWLENQLHKALPISQSSEKIRNKFFSTQFRRIEKMMDKVS